MGAEIQRYPTRAQSSKAERRTLWTPWCNKLIHHSWPRCSTSPFQQSSESLRSYIQRFNAESLKVDVQDEKFAITAFIARLGVQLKDLMFSISKNPQASMAEVFSKEEKYINGEEALISKKESSSTHKEINRTDKNRDEALRDRETGRDPQRKTGNGPRKDERASETA